MVASDYRLLYRGVPAAATGNSEKPFLVIIANLADTYADPSNANRAPVASDFLALLDSTLSAGSTSADDGLSTSTSTAHFHLALTNPKEIATQQVAMSIWPMGPNVHFAWTENPDESLLSTTTRVTSNKLIVDGIDCGKMSLEDALQRPRGQVILYTSS